MESQVSLALAVKLAKIFESDTSYLSFPLGTGFSYRYLGFMKPPEQSGLSLQEQLNDKADFARLLNIVPSDGPAFIGDASRLLWQRLVQVLEEARFPASGLSAQEEQTLAKAIEFLTDTVVLSDGSAIAVNSAALNRYYEFKTLRDQAEMAYLDEKISVEMSTGPEGEALQRRWKEFRERQLLDVLQVADDNWNNLGFRQQVQAAQRTRADLEPKRDLSAYRSNYLADIALSQLADINAVGLETCVTFFSPLDAFEPGTAWNSVTLTRAEMAALIAEAPANLRQTFGGAESSGDFESVSLELNNVAVIRPWFRQDFFASRTWDVPAAQRVSDGGTPRQGEIPAYITSMLVARNVVVRRRRTQAPPPTPVVLPILSAVALQSLKLERASPAARAGAGAAVPVSSSPVIRKAASVQLLGAKAASVGVTSMAAARPLAANVALRPTLDARAPTAASGASVTRVALARELTEARYVGTTIRSPAPPKAPPPPEPAPADVVEERYSFDGVTVLAWVCKRVPRCPDPDPALTW